MVDRQQQDFEFLSVPSEQWLSARIYPRDDGGLSVFVQDISRRRQAEERLRASEAHFHAVANLGPDLLWQNKPDGTVTWSNEGWRNYLGQPLEAIKDGGWSIVHPDDAKTTRRIFESELRGTQPVTYEERMRRKDGVYRWFLMRVRPVLNEQGRVHHWFGAATDIDDLKHLQQQQQLLVAELQHRTRNLLTVVDRSQHRYCKDRKSTRLNSSH